MIPYLEERYSSLIFLLHHFPYTKKAPEAICVEALPPLEEVEVLYLDGLKYLSLYQEMHEWLQKDSERDLVILEEDLGKIAHFLEEERAEGILFHPQVHLFFLLEGKTREQLYEELSREFPFRRIAVLGDEAMRLSLLRKTAVAEGLFAEDLGYHQIVENLWLNAVHFLDAYDGDCLEGAFHGIPALICGAGPSLTGELDRLKSLSDKALIFAGGSTMTALSKGGVRPHFTFALDPNPQERERLEGSLTFEVPLFYGGRLKAGVLDLVNGMKVYMRTHTGGVFEAYLQEELGLGRREVAEGFSEEALSVTTTCLSMAVRMGCNPIYFVGVDLAFTGGKSYASGVVLEARVQVEELKKEGRSSESFLEWIGQGGEKVPTLVKWVMESQAMGSFMASHRETTFINATRGGLGFPGVPFCPLEEVRWERVFDLEGLVHTVLSQHPLEVEREVLEGVKGSLKESLRRVLGVIEEMIEAPQKEIYLGYELEEEVAFRVILFPISQAVHRMAKRKYRNDLFKQSEVKWNYLKRVVEYLLSIF